MVNADRHAEGFHGEMKFSETLIHYEHDVSWIDREVNNMIDCLNSDKLPESHISCENCAYAKQRNSIE